MDMFFIIVGSLYVVLVMMEFCFFLFPTLTWSASDRALYRKVKNLKWTSTDSGYSSSEFTITKASPHFYSLYKGNEYLSSSGSENSHVLESLLNQIRLNKMNDSLAKIDQLIKQNKELSANLDEILKARSA